MNRLSSDTLAGVVLRHHQVKYLHKNEYFQGTRIPGILNCWTCFIMPSKVGFYIECFMAMVALKGFVTCMRLHVSSEV